MSSDMIDDCIIIQITKQTAVCFFIAKIKE